MLPGVQKALQVLGRDACILEASPVELTARFLPAARDRQEQHDLMQDPTCTAALIDPCLCHAGLNGLLAADESDLQSDPADEPVASTSKSRRKQEMRYRGKRLLKTGMGSFGLSDMETFWDTRYNMKATLAWNKTTVVLAFRGTASWANAFSDLKAWHAL